MAAPARLWRSWPRSWGHPCGGRRRPRPGPRAASSQLDRCGGVTWQVRTQDPERAEVTAYQDGDWLGRAIVPVDAIAPARRRRSGTKAGDVPRTPTEPV